MRAIGKRELMDMPQEVESVELNRQNTFILGLYYCYFVIWFYFT